MGSTLPLAGKRIAVTRPRKQSAALVEALRALGATVIEAPAIRIDPPSDPAPLDRALEQLDEYDWVIFTSVNGVEAFFERLERPPGDEIFFAAIGPATERVLRERGIAPAVVPERYVAEEIFRVLEARTNVRGKRFLLPRADIARDALPNLLRANGAHVDVVAAYRTVAETEPVEEIARLVARGEVDVVTFTSASTVRSFFDGMGSTPHLEGLMYASIGPITSAALRERGLVPAIEAEDYTADGLVRALVQYFSHSSKT